MRRGTCKRVEGGRKLCRLQNGKVRFVKSGRRGTRGLAKSSGGTRGTKGLGRARLRGRKCVRFGRANGRKVCRKYSTPASRRRNR